MKKQSEYTLFLELISQNLDGIYSTTDILRLGQEHEVPFEFMDLVNLWEEGKLYTEKIARTQTGYQPAPDSRWTCRFQSGFFGYDTALGAYYISGSTPNPIDCQLEATISLNSAAVCIAVSPDQCHFAIGSLNGAITICSLETGTIIRVVQPCNNRTWTLCYSPNGEFLVSGHQNGNLFVFDSQGNQLAKAEAVDWVRSISFFPDSSQFLTSHKVNDSESPTVRQWTLSPLKDFTSFIHLKGTVWSVCCLKYGEGFITGGHDRTVTYYSFKKGNVVWAQKKHTGTVTKLAIHPYGGIVASASWSGSVKLWDLESSDDVRTIEAHAARVYAISFSPSGKVLATGGKDSHIALWQLPGGTSISHFRAHTGWIRGLEFMKEDTLLQLAAKGCVRFGV